ncbi:hypothetical protein T11_15954 [Trichinella zimbabwensis]|uniref:FLYWCH-type domain-containing protein n=1 Tax=Trichinella zimbabwensis TaxID=268475 RepID=A0A0V1HQN6_9BILA|nr:hypothetical protein T11_15954 [Trichinella zimbabwensis]
MESDEIQFVCTQRNQQKLVYRGRCYTLKRTNRNDKCWICALGMRGGCREDPHAFYHQQQLNELKRLAAGDLRPVSEICDELASNASTFLMMLTFHRGTSPETQCTTAGPGNTHDFRPGGRIYG